MKNKTLKYILCLALAIVSIFAFACANLVTLLDFNDKTESVSILSYYVVDTSGVSDTEGNVYKVSATVKDSDGNEVAYKDTGRFLVTDKEGYTIKYTANLGNETKSRTVTVEVVNNVKPILRITDGSHVAEIGEVYSLPTAVALDSSAQNLDVTYTVLNEKQEAQTFNAQNKTFTPTVDGAYTIVASAVDEDGNAASEQFELHVRKPVEENEIESFNDKGSYYTTVPHSRTENYEWHENVLGRDGVMQFDIAKSNLSGDLFRINPRKALDDYMIAYEEGGETKYRNNKYIVFTMYVEANENVVRDFAFHSGGTEYFVKEKVQYNQWKDYVFPADRYVSTMKAAESDWNTRRKNFWGLGVDDFTIYLDKISFVDSLTEVTGELAEAKVGDEVSLADAITTTADVELEYNVYLAGKLVAQTDDKFVPQWKGDYKVVASTVAPVSAALAENEFTLTVNGLTNGHVAKINDYTDYILYDANDESTHDYVLPEIKLYEADGVTPVSQDILDEYTFKTSITRVSPAGVYTYNSSFSKTIRGVLHYDLTATHPTYGSFRKYATVTVGPIAENEVVNFEYVDALKQVGVSGFNTPEQFKNILGESDPNRYQGLNILHLAKDQISNNNSSYVNIAPINSTEIYQTIIDLPENAIKNVIVRFPVYVETTDMETRSSVQLTVLGTVFEVFVGKWTNLELPATQLVSYMNQGKLYNVANSNYFSGDYIMNLKPTAAEPFYDANSSTRIDLDLYLGNVTVEAVIPTTEELENVFMATKEDLYKITSAASEANIHLATTEELALIDNTETGYTGGAAVVSFGSGNCPDLTYNGEIRKFINNEAFIEEGFCGYTHLSIMYAVLPHENGGGVTITSGLIHDWFKSSGLSGNYYSFSEAQGNVNKWIEFLIPIEKILAYGTDVNKFRMAVRYSGSSAGSVMWKAYVGEIKVKKVIPTQEGLENVFMPTEDDLYKITSSATTPNIHLATTEELTLVSKGNTNYTGGAAVVDFGPGNCPDLTFLASTRTLINNEWYRKEGFCGYTHLSIMYAVLPHENGGSVTITSGLIHDWFTSSGLSGNYYSFSEANGNVNKWIEFLIPIEKILEYGSNVNKFRIGVRYGNSSAGSVMWKAYVGEIKLKKVVPTVTELENVFVASEDNLDKITGVRVNGMATATELNAISGNGTFYTGNAVSVAVTQGNGPSILTSFAERKFINNEDYPEFCGYNYLSIWLAVKPGEGYETTSMGVTNGLIQDHLETALSNYLWFGSTQKYPINTWINFIVPIENLTGLAEDATSKRILSSYINSGAEWTAYVGDMTLLKDLPADYDGANGGMLVKPAQ